VKGNRNKAWIAGFGGTPNEGNWQDRLESPALLPPIVWFAIKAGVFIAFFILLRAAIPRPRYDQLMRYGWLFLLPLSLLNLLVTGAVILLGSGG